MKKCRGGTVVSSRQPPLHVTIPVEVVILRAEKPLLPSERSETLRQGIISLLRRDDATAMDISAEIGLPVNEVYDHLSHIRHSLQRTGELLQVLPAACKNCGFVFAKRGRYKRPGRCPVCRGQSISQPRYRIATEERASSE